MLMRAALALRCLSTPRSPFTQAFGLSTRRWPKWFFFVAEPAEEAEDPLARLHAAKDDHHHDDGTCQQRGDDHPDGEDRADKRVHALYDARAGHARAEA